MAINDVDTFSQIVHLYHPNGKIDRVLVHGIDVTPDTIPSSIQVRHEFDADPIPQFLKIEVLPRLHSLVTPDTIHATLKQTSLQRGHGGELLLGNNVQFYLNPLQHWIVVLPFKRPETEYSTILELLDLYKAERTMDDVWIIVNYNLPRDNLLMYQRATDLTEQLRRALYALPHNRPSLVDDLLVADPYGWTRLYARGSPYAPRDPQRV
jgi:hypothetical protein